MRFGMLHLFENPIGKTEHEIIHEQIALMRAAEDLGSTPSDRPSITSRNTATAPLLR